MHYLLTTALLLSTLAIAQADVYKCLDHTGKALYQNHPCNDQALPHLTTNTLSTPPPALPPRQAEEPQPPSIVSAPAASAPAAPAPAAPAPPAATPVSTTQLSIIKLGMSMAEVENKLGNPGSVTQTGNAFIAREQWVYPGAGGVKAAVIIFESGRVAYRGREGSEYKREVGDFVHRKQ